MRLNITNKDGITLKTKDKFIREDISVGLTDEDKSKLISENIKKDVSLFNGELVGSYEGEGGGTETEDALIEGTLTEYTNDRITKMKTYAFYYNTNLTSVSCENVYNVASYAFQNCSKLESASFPKATTIGNSAFSKCSNLTSVSLENVSTINSYAFQSCKLENVNLPKTVSIASRAFDGCKTKSISLQSMTSLSSNALYGMKELVSAYLPINTYFGDYAFMGCYSLKAVIITQTDSVATLTYSTVFENCVHILGTVNSIYNPEGLKDGYIYVPDTMVDQYKNNTNWSVYADQIKPISELPQEYRDLYGIN